MSQKNEKVTANTTVTTTATVEEQVIPPESYFAFAAERDRFRSMISNVYGIQKLRIQCGNRLVASVKGLGEKSRNRTAESVKAELEAKKKAEEDMASEESMDGEDKETAKILKQVRDEYSRITDIISLEARSKSLTDSTIKKAIAKANEGGELLLLGNVYDYKMAYQYESLLTLEENAVKAISTEVMKHPMWDKFFANVRGCGPVIAAVCLAYFDVYKARHPAGFWKYAGLDVVLTAEGNYEGRDRRHIETQTIVDKEGNLQEKKGITYNPKLKSKLLGVLGSSFVKHARKDGALVGYGKVYYDYKARLENRIDADKLTPIRKHKMAVRFAVKQFVRDLWIAWRTHEGLEVGEPYYEVAKLGHASHGYNY